MLWLQPSMRFWLKEDPVFPRGSSSRQRDASAGGPPWPRGVSKQALKAAHWLREVTPSDQLRQWFGHDPDRWEEFKHRYFAELQAKPELINFLLELARAKGLVLFFSARDLHCNQAVALQRYLLSLMQKNKGASQTNGR